MVLLRKRSPVLELACIAALIAAATAAPLAVLAASLP
jgi:hypothetical protein